MSLLPSHVLDAKRRLAEGYEALKARHRAGCPGTELCVLLTDLRDRVVLDLYAAALEDLAPALADQLRTQVALVAHGGYGRRDLAPHSDLDLMILHGGGASTSAAAAAWQKQVARLAERFWRDLFDAGLIVGHSVRTPSEAACLAWREPLIATSLVESRQLAGSQALFSDFLRVFRRYIRRGPQRLITAVVAQRAKERERYGETVYLLEPNVKRSKGALRDLHLLRWIGLVRYGTPEPARLQSLEVLAQEDLEALERARAFLLRLRNEMHFYAGRAADALDRAEQVRIAEGFGYQAVAGQMPVECFMQEYFRHSQQVSYIAERFVAEARSLGRLNRVLTTVFGHRIEPGLEIGPAGLLAAPGTLEERSGDLTAIIRMADLANRYNKPIASETWGVIRRQVPRLPAPPSAVPPSPEACRHFLSLLDHPAQLGRLLEDLHGIGVLERFVPAFARTRGLLQFNQYHHYTVDEHCLRAVRCATRLLFDMGPQGRTYRGIASKRILHLALLIHDLGKGLEEDHCEAGLRIAAQTAERLGLSAPESETLKFLVHKHLLLSRLAFHRDTSDEQLLIAFAREVGSAELLRMLFVLTAADLAAVGPGVWDGWKAQIVTDLYHRTMHYLADDSPATTPDWDLQHGREAVCQELGEQQRDPWFVRQLDALPASHLLAAQPAQVAADLRLLREVQPGKTTASGRYLPETDTVQYTVGAYEETTPGVFHRLTGALTSHGLEIRSAEINTLAGGLILDRFWVRDLDYAGEPPPERIEQLTAALVQSLQPSGDQAPSFRRRHTSARRSVAVPGPQTRVSVDNTTSERYTIIDVFTEDCLGLLHAVARTLFELGLSVWRARISTYGDRVVNVFYVTDRQGCKVEDERQLAEVQRRLGQRIEAVHDAQRSARE